MAKLIEEYQEAVSSLLTLLDIVRWGASQMQRAQVHLGHGTDDPIGEMMLLAESILALEQAQLSSLMNCRLTLEERQQFVELIQKRISTRMPAAYLVKQAYFAGLKFYVDERVLIPRSPIAECIAQHFEPWLENTTVTRILDLATGSGCIAIACAHAFPEAKVDAVDISAEALEVAVINIEDQKLKEQVHLYQGHLFEPLAKKKYDLIVSNPPYVPNADLDHLPKEYRYEPTLALKAGEDGLDIVREILAKAAEHLTSEGILVVEVGNGVEALQAAYPNVPFIWVEFANSEDGVFVLTAEQLKHLE